MNNATNAERAAVRCAVCGIPWKEHDTDVICDQYRPTQGKRLVNGFRDAKAWLDRKAEEMCFDPRKPESAPILRAANLRMAVEINGPGELPVRPEIVLRGSSLWLVQRDVANEKVKALEADNLLLRTQRDAMLVEVDQVKELKKQVDALIVQLAAGDARLERASDYARKLEAEIVNLKATTVPRPVQRWYCGAVDHEHNSIEEATACIKREYLKPATGSSKTC